MIFGGQPYKSKINTFEHILNHALNDEIPFETHL